MKRLHLICLAAACLTASALAAATYTSVNLTLNQSRGNLTIRSQASASPLLNASTPAIRDGVAFVTLAHAGDWALKLSPKLPVTLNVQRSKGDAWLDLRPLKLTGLTLLQEDGVLKLSLPTETLDVHLDQTRGETVITLPKAVGVRVKAEQFSQGELVMNGKTVAAGSDSDDKYQSDNFEAAKHKVNIYLTLVDGKLILKSSP